MHTPIRVLVADDHPVVREGLKAILAHHHGFTVVGEADSFARVQTTLAATNVDVLILDIVGMDGSPLGCIATIRRTFPAMRIIMFSSSFDLAPELLKAGSHGYVAKEELATHLLDAICAHKTTTPFLSPRVQQYLDSTDATTRIIAPAELSVLKLLARGNTTEEIATYMVINPRTVQNYITELRRKLGCDGRVQLVDWYHRMYPINHEWECNPSP